jgi:hypothetical protein
MVKSKIILTIFIFIFSIYAKPNSFDSSFFRFNNSYHLQSDFHSINSSINNENGNDNNHILSNDSNDKEKFWRTQKWIALGSTVAFFGTGLLCSSTADGYYDDYLKELNTSVAVDLYNKSSDFDLYKDISYGISISGLGYFFYAWYMESKY